MKQGQITKKMQKVLDALDNKRIRCKGCNKWIGVENCDGYCLECNNNLNDENKN